MVDIVVRVSVKDGEYRYRCGRSTDGIDWAPVGCVHRLPRESVDHVDALEARMKATRATYPVRWER